MLRDLVIAFSMANLWFIDLWQVFLIPHASGYPYYHWKLNPATFLLATMLDALILATILFASMTLVRRTNKQALSITARAILVLVVFLLIMNLPLGLLLNPGQNFVLFRWRGSTTVYLWLVALALAAGWLLAAVFIYASLFRRQHLIKIATSMVLVTAPMTLITFSQASWQWFQYRSGNQFRSGVVRALPPNPARPRRVLWIVFDELDFNLSFLNRPANVELPEFDRLRRESLFAENAHPPADDTLLSIPALITGRLVTKSVPRNPNELMLTFEDESASVGWSTQPNVFSKARAMGLNTGLVGWYHPYCRIIGNDLTDCSWETTTMLFFADARTGDFVSHSEKASLASCMKQVAKGLLFPWLARIVFPIDYGTVWRSHSISEFENIHHRAMQMAVDSNLSFVFLHYPIPHPPGIYDPHSNSLTTSHDAGYANNLLLADRVLEELRQRMTAAGEWERTTLVITSDHHLRSERLWNADELLLEPGAFTKQVDSRIPFLVKLGGSNEGVEYDSEFNTVVTGDLLLAVLSGKVSTKDDLVSWLNEHRIMAKSLYTEEK